MKIYDTISQLCAKEGIAITVLEAKLGFGRGSIGKLKNGGGISSARLQKIADFFGVTVDYLMTGEQKIPTLNTRDERDIAKRLEETLADLENSQEALMFSGEPLDEQTKELLKASLENSLKIAKINAKQKFTPKKYRHTNE